MTRILIVFVILATARSARADVVEDARKYFDAGRQAYESGSYSVATSAFEEAYRLAPRASIVFSLAQSYRRQYSVDRDNAKLVRAGALYRQYIKEIGQGERREEAVRLLGEIEPLLLRIEEKNLKGGKVAPVHQPTQLMVSSQTKGTRAAIDGGALAAIPVIAEVTTGTHKVRVEADGYFPKDVDATAVDGRLVVAEVNLEEKPAQLTVRAATGSQITVDGRSAGLAPLTAPISLPAGTHLVTVSRRGHESWSRELRLERGEARALEPTAPQTTQRRVSRWFFYGAGGLAVLGGATTALNVLSRRDAGKLQDQIDAGSGTPDTLAEHNRAASRAGNYATASKLLFAGALAAATTGVLLHYLDMPGAKGESRIVPAITADGIGATFATRF